MYRRRVTVASGVGLHARPAAMLAQAAAGQPVPVTIGKVSEGVAGRVVDAGSVLGLMTLGAHHGEEVELAAEGEGAQVAVDELVSLLQRDLDEDPESASARVR